MMGSFFHPAKGLLSVAANIGEERQIELQDIVNDFLQSDETDLTFPPSLSNQDRLFLHQMAQKSNLKHQSSGGGLNRRLTLSKQINRDEFFVNVKLDQRSAKYLTHALQDISNLPMLQKFQNCTNLRGERTDSSNSVKFRAGIPTQSRASPDLNKFRSTLPIHSYRNNILEVINANQISMIAAETGAGKTTQVPQYLLEWSHSVSQECLIFCSQPRRLAAMSSAERIAAERNETIGSTVGYCVKLENRMNASLTRLLFCTTGTLLRMLIMDSSFLLRATHLIIDEVHERDRFTDFLLCVLKKFCEDNKRLKVVLMSASMNERLLSDYFNSCPVVRVPGRMFPVQQFFLENILIKLKRWKNKVKESGNLEVTTAQIELDIAAIDLKANGSENFATGVAQSSLATLRSDGGREEKGAVTSGVGTEGESVELLADTFVVYDDAAQDTVEMTFGDVDNLLLLFFHTVTSEAFNLILKLTLNSTIPVDYRHSESGMTVLMIACAHGQVDMVNQLLQLGASPQLSDCEGKTAFDYAVHNQHLNVEQILNQYSKFVEVCEEDGDEEESGGLVDDYVRAFSAETESVDYDLILEVLLYLVDQFSHQQNVPTKGAVLVFLPGYEEISRMKYMIECDDVLGEANEFRVFVLHSNVKSDDQKKVFDPCKQRKLILATNIAETSLTIEDVVFVVDPGKTKQRELDTMSSLSYSLQTGWVSKANVKQRAGRAGRTRPGYSFHLFSKTRFESMKDFTVPEILRYPLNDLCLQTKVVFPSRFSVQDILTEVPDAPSLSSIESALNHLKDIEALDADENLTDLGSFLVKMPLDPDLARMVLYSLVFRCLDPICIIVASLAYRSPFYLPVSKKLIDESERRKKNLSFNSQSDHFILLFAFLTWHNFVSTGRHAKADEFCYNHHLSTPVLQVIEKTRLQIHKHLVAQNVIKSPKSFVYFNVKSRSTACIRASVFAALSHSTVVYDQNRAKYCADWGNNLKVHKSSVCCFAPYSESTPQFLCCDEISRGIGQPQIKSCTAVPSFLLLLLSNRVAEQQSASEEFRLFEISKSVKLTCSNQLAQVVLALRKVILHCVVSLTEGVFIDKEFQGVVECLTDSLETLEPSDIGFIQQQNYFAFANEKLFERDHALASNIGRGHRVAMSVPRPVSSSRERSDRGSQFKAPSNFYR